MLKKGKHWTSICRYCLYWTVPCISMVVISSCSDCKYLGIY